MSRAPTPAQTGQREPARDATGAKPAPSPAGWTRFLRPLLVGLMFAAAFALRLFHIQDPPLDFHPTRQYRSAMLARGMYFAREPSIEAWRREVAVINGDQQLLLEPPLMESLACLGYRLAGSEQLWIPRVIALCFFLGAGATLYLLVARLVSGGAAVAASAFYLFCPYMLLAGRSFQPDALMMFTQGLALLALLRHQRAPGRGRWIAAVGLFALTALVKPMAAFAPLAVHGLDLLARRGWRASLTDPALWVYSLGGLAPALVYYGVLAMNFSAQGSSTSFVPGLWLTAGFWANWLRLAAHVAGPWALALGLLGWIHLALRGRETAVWIAGLLAGYLGMGLLFTYTMQTHDYYHLLLVPVVALGLSPLGRFAGLALDRAPGWLRLGATGLAALAVLVYAWTMRWNLELADRRPESTAPRIGELVRHSTRTVLLAPYYGKPLAYHGELSGLIWPETNELNALRIKGLPVQAACDRLDALLAAHAPEYFIITDLRDWQAQGDLRACLEGRFPLLERTEDHLIFSLKAPAP